MTEAIGGLKAMQLQLQDMDGGLDQVRDQVMGLEGRASRTYWAAVSRLLPETYRFEGRSRNPAKDEFNCLLNYAYGVLYGLVERACLLAGLDPYIGFVHTDHYNKPSLVFDVIENYRIWADETVVQLFSRHKIKKTLFDQLKNGLTLNKEGKAILLEALTEHLDERIRYRNRNISRRDAVQFDLHRIANDLLKEEP